MAAMWATVAGLLLLLPLLPPASSSSSMVLKLHGDVYPTGHFYVIMNIGEPAKPYFLDIDTGSNLTWLECDAGHGSSKTCNKVPHPLHQATQSRLVPCADQLCDTLHQDLGTTKNCRGTPRQCDYHIAYLDGSSSLGVLLVDKFSVPLRKAPNTRADIAFGCGYDQVGNSKPATVAVDGILGLGRGSVDLVSQLKHQRIITKNVIGHCLATKGGGYLFIGLDNVPAASLTWVPMAPRTPGKPNHYSPGQATLHLNEKPIDAKPMKVVFDSGSTYTYLPAALHTQLVSALEHSLSKSLKKVNDPALPLCWEQSGGFKSLNDLKKEFKSVMSLKFHNGATMMIPPENYLVITKGGNACLGVLGMPNLDMYIIGDITLQDQLVIYDNEKGQLGWAHFQCDRPPKSTSAIFSRI